MDTHTCTHTLTRTLTAPLNAGQTQDSVCLEAQDQDLTIFKGGPGPHSHPEAVSFKPGLWLVALFALVTPQWGAQMSSFLSPGPLLLDLFLPGSMGSAPPPHPTVIPHSPPWPTVGGGSAQGETVASSCAFAGMQTNLFSEAFFCSHNPPTCPSEKGEGSCPPHFLG